MNNIKEITDMKTIYRDNTGPLVRYGNGFLNIEDLNPEVRTRWRMSRYELLMFGLRAIWAAVHRTKVKATITAYLAATRQEDGWQPIETAPSDAVWAFVPAFNMQCVAWFADGRWWTPARADGRLAIPAPSHWRPLPSPPEGGN